MYPTPATCVSGHCYRGFALILDANFGLDRKAGAQEVIAVLAGQVVEVDTYRDALDHFDVVAGGILGREERENRARRATDLGNFAVVRLARGVYLDFDGLASGNVFELGLLEVGSDPEIVQRDKCEQVLAGRDVLVELEALAGDDAVRGDRKSVV